MCKEDPSTTVQKLIEIGSPHIFYVDPDYRMVSAGSHYVQRALNASE